MINEIIEKWENFYRTIEDNEFSEYEYKEDILNLADEIDKYMNKPILGIISTPNPIHSLVDNITTIYNDEINKQHIISSGHSIKENLEQLIKFLNNVEHIDFYALLIENNYDLFIKNKIELKDKINQELRKSISQKVSETFDEEYSSLEQVITDNNVLFKKWLKRLFAILVVIFGVSMYLFIAHNFKDYTFLILMKITLVLPIIWYLAKLSKTIKEDRLLMHAYQHKKVLAQAYINYAETINNDMYFGDEEMKKETIKMLLNCSLEVLKENPTNALQKNTVNEDSIALKILDKLPTRSN